MTMLMRLHGVAFALLAAGCSVPGAPIAAANLDALPAETAWKLLDSDIDGLGSAEAAAIRLRIESNRLTGDSGCNSFGGSFAFSGNVLSIGPIAASKRGCPGPRAVVESALFGALPKVTSARSEGEQLVLMTADGKRLRFVRDGAVDG